MTLLSVLMGFIFQQSMIIGPAVKHLHQTKGRIALGISGNKVIYFRMMKHRKLRLLK